MKNNAWQVLKERGFIKQTVFEEDLIKLLSQQSLTFYVGFDPTADSLHIGHYIPVMAMMHLQRAGHKPIILLGGGTGLIGDPSGKSDLREVLAQNIAESNVQKFKAQLSKFFDFSGNNGAIIENNASWLKELNYISFLREVGAHFSVNKMLTADCYKQRMEKGLTFLEFNYMLMQAYDFLVLHQKYGCNLQIGGNDQWSNILAGADLIRRKERKDAYAFTLPLLETSQGVKMGKTQKGALWLSKDKTPAYEFYQYFRNVEDEKVEECMRLLTFMDMEEIKELTAFKDERINKAKSRLAFEVTKLIHSQEDAILAEQQSEGAFGSGDVMPSINIEAGLNTMVVDLMVLTNTAASKSEARRLIEGGGVKINESKIQGVNDTILSHCKDKEFVLHKGKKVHLKVILK